MKRRWRLWLILAMLLLGDSLLHPAVHWRLIGWAKGEAFYQGRPKSYWRWEWEWWHPMWTSAGAFLPDYALERYVWYRSPSDWATILDNRFGIKVNSPDRLPLLKGDVESVPVLLQLLETQNNDLKLIACGGRQLIGQRAANEAVPILLRLVRKNDDFSSSAWEALYRIDPELAQVNQP